MSAAKPEQNVGAIGKSRQKPWPNPEGVSAGIERVFAPAKFLEHISPIAGGFIVGGIQGKRRVIGRKRLLRPGKRLQGYPLVVEGLGIALRYCEARS